MKVVHVNTSDLNGGAAIAAYRIHQALRVRGVDSFMAVNDKRSGHWTVDGPETAFAKVSAKLRPHIASRISKLQSTPNTVIHSPAVLSGGLSARLGRRSAQIVHLHWINSGMGSVAEIGKLPFPIVWTLHDMWPFCGAEHYTTEERWKAGYTASNRPEGHRGLDIDRWVWRRKKRHWVHPMQIVTPSRWLADCVSQSALMADWPVRVIHNALDTEVWVPLSRSLARQLLNLPQNKKLVLFGAMGGASDHRKGADLLIAALQRMRQSNNDIELVIFGQSEPKDRVDLGFPIHYMGSIHDEVALRLLYGACDSFVLPSRQDNLPNTGVEAQASGRPVVAFNIGGLSDIVRHEQSGYLAQPFDVDDLARGLSWVLESETRWQNLSENAEAHARTQFSARHVAAQYQALYAECLDGQKT